MTGQTKLEDFVQGLKAIGSQWRVAHSSPADASAGDARQAQIHAHIEQQILFEKWVKRDSWLLRDEAMPLLLGAAPEAWGEFGNDPERQQVLAGLWALLQACVRQNGSPRVLNPEDPVGQWRVSPADLHGWAGYARIPVPAAYDMLMSFVRKAVKRDDMPADTASPFDFGQAQAPATSTGEASVREQILGAALTMLANFPKDCRDENGFVEGHRIAERILQRQAVLFEEGLPEMGAAEIGELLDRWVRALE